MNPTTPVHDFVILPQEVPSDETAKLKLQIAELLKDKEEQKKTIEDLAGQLTLKTQQLESLRQGFGHVISINEEARTTVLIEQQKLEEKASNENTFLQQNLITVLDYMKGFPVSPQLGERVSLIQRSDILRTSEDFQRKNENKGTLVTVVNNLFSELVKSNNETRLEAIKGNDLSQTLFYATSKKFLMIPEMLRKVMVLESCSKPSEEKLSEYKSEMETLKLSFEQLLDSFLNQIKTFENPNYEREHLKNFFQDNDPQSEKKSLTRLGEHCKKHLLWLKEFNSNALKKWYQIHFKLIEVEMKIWLIKHTFSQFLDEFLLKMNFLLETVGNKCDELNGKHRANMNEVEIHNLVSLNKPFVDSYESIFSKMIPDWIRLNGFLENWRSEYEVKYRSHYYYLTLEEELKKLILKQYSETTLRNDLKKLHLELASSLRKLNHDYKIKFKNIHSTMRPIAMKLDWAKELLEKNIHRILPIYPYNFPVPAGQNLTQWDEAAKAIDSQRKFKVKEEEEFIVFEDEPVASEIELNDELS